MLGTLKGVLSSVICGLWLDVCLAGFRSCSRGNSLFDFFGFVRVDLNAGLPGKPRGPMRCPWVFAVSVASGQAELTARTTWVVRWWTVSE